MRGWILFDYLEHHDLIAASLRFLEKVSQEPPRHASSARGRDYPHSPDTRNISGAINVSEAGQALGRSGKAAVADIRSLMEDETSETSGIHFEGTSDVTSERLGENRRLLR